MIAFLLVPEDTRSENLERKARHTLEICSSKGRIEEASALCPCWDPAVDALQDIWQCEDEEESSYVTGPDIHCSRCLGTGWVSSKVEISFGCSWTFRLQPSLVPSDRRAWEENVCSLCRGNGLMKVSKSGFVSRWVDDDCLDPDAVGSDDSEPTPPHKCHMCRGKGVVLRDPEWGMSRVEDVLRITPLPIPDLFVMSNGYWRTSVQLPSSRRIIGKADWSAEWLRNLRKSNGEKLVVCELTTCPPARRTRS